MDMMDNPHQHQAMECHQISPSRNSPSSACIPSTNRREWFRTSTLLRTHIPGVTACHHCTLGRPKIWQIFYGEYLFSMIGLEKNYAAERTAIIDWNFTASLWSLPQSHRIPLTTAHKNNQNIKSLKWTQTWKHYWSLPWKVHCAYI